MVFLKTKLRLWVFIFCTETFVKVTLAAKRCGELETALPGSDLPSSWPWVKHGNDCINIAVDKIWALRYRFVIIII